MMTLLGHPSSIVVHIEVDVSSSLWAETMQPFWMVLTKSTFCDVGPTTCEKNRPNGDALQMLKESLRLHEADFAKCSVHVFERCCLQQQCRTLKPASGSEDFYVCVFATYKLSI
mmetsp:Transcript_64267/g.139856  ORF Transcript_64267/g.139856 Transcript_64267/m.139856 type:complete len:114 (+) Transcript_64267:1660-2001(+)